VKEKSWGPSGWASSRTVTVPEGGGTGCHAGWLSSTVLFVIRV
jgi:hypothetical protein